MNSILAVISGRQLTDAFIFFAIGACIWALLFWLWGKIAAPEPFFKVGTIALYVIAVVICINFLLAVAGHPWLGW